MENWWIILICVAVAVTLHIIVNIKIWKVAIALNFIFHIDSIALFLLLEMGLQEVFIFLLSSITANMLIQAYIQTKNNLSK